MLQWKSDSHRCRQLIELAQSFGLRYVATNNVHYATRDRHRLHDVLVCIKSGTTLEKLGHLRRPNAEFYLKASAEMSELFAEYPEALENTLFIVDQCDISLDFSSYRFPDFPLPAGETADSFLAKLCWQKVRERYVAE